MQMNMLQCICTAATRGGTGADVASGMGANIKMVTGLHNLEVRGGKDAARRVSLADKEGL
jgi:hypothetical protein